MYGGYNFTVISRIPDLSEDSLKRIYEHLYQYHVKVFYINKYFKIKSLLRVENVYIHFTCAI